MKTASLVFAALLMPVIPAFAQTAAQTSAASFAPPGAGLMGQQVYNAKGQVIGTVTAITSDTNGQQLAGVRTEAGQGTNGATVLFPSNALKPKPGGGVTTELSAEEIKALPKSQTPAG